MKTRAMATVLAFTLAAMGSSQAHAGRFADTNSVWGTLLLRAQVATIASEYPHYAPFAYDFVDNAGPVRYNRFWHHHDAGDKKTARTFLRKHVDGD